MELIKLCKDSGSGDGGCPAAYVTDTSPANYRGGSPKRGVVIQGIRVPVTELDDYAEHETAGWVPDNVILRAAPRIVWHRIRNWRNAA